MTEPTLTINWHMIHAPQPGNVHSGDNFVVDTYDGGFFLSVIDGLGHGPKAEEASRSAVGALQDRLHESPEKIMERCHRAMIGTRGAVVTIASVSAITGAMTWIGVGNVSAVLLHGTERNSESMRDHLLLRGGIVGYRMPPLRSFNLTISPGDTLVMTTDGIRSGFMEDIPLDNSPEAIAQHIHGGYSRGTDDALVLVTRFAAANGSTVPVKTGTLELPPMNTIL